MTFIDIVYHPIVISIFFSWLLAQLIKTILDVVYYQREFSLHRLIFEKGGMPSSHASSVSALAAGIYLIEGVTTTFLLASLYAIVTMVDASGVRRAVGENSLVLNKIINELKRTLRGRFHSRDTATVVVGHTGIQVVAGCLLGIAITLIVFFA